MLGECLVSHDSAQRTYGSRQPPSLLIQFELRGKDSSFSNSVHCIGDCRESRTEARDASRPLAGETGEGPK